MQSDPHWLMQTAVDVARRGIAAEQSPFGCAIMIGEDLIAVEHNTVRATVDTTAHAEINAIRAACTRIGDIHLTGAVVATTCEPCPMCLAALHWARVDCVHYGATIADATAAGFNELRISAVDLAKLTGSSLRLVSGPLAVECRALFQEWLDGPRGMAY